MDVLILLDLRSLTTTVLSRFASTLPMRSFSSSSISTCLCLNRRSMSGKELNGRMLTLAWICRNVLHCLKSLWVFLPFLKKNPSSPRPLMQHLLPSCMRTCMANLPVRTSKRLPQSLTQWLTLPLSIMLPLFPTT